MTAILTGGEEIPYYSFYLHFSNTETPILWPPHPKSWLAGKNPKAGNDWGQEEKGMTEDEMTGWHHRLDGHGFVYTPGVGDGQGGLACCRTWGRKESDMTERLNWTEYWVMLSIFSPCVYWPFACLLWRNVYLGSSAHFLSGCVFLWYWAIWTNISWWLILLVHLQLFSPILRIVFSSCS